MMNSCCRSRFSFLLLSIALFAATASAADWPMWRYDAARSGASPEALPEQLHLQWSLQLPKPRPAWRGDQDKLQFDLSYEPIVVGKLLIVPSMSRDNVSAYDTETAKLQWRFYTDGPVRFAPAADKGDLFFACDDGYLYCLGAADGALKWKLRGGPGDQRILGNDRLISMWPARGGPVVKDGVVYFAASIWPFMGTFIHAVDARTGEVIWTNSGSGSNYIVQQHGSPAFSGVAPQGYLAADDQTLLVAGGRTVPAAYELADGAFRYFLPGSRNAGKDAGGYGVIIADDWFYNRDAMYDTEKGGLVGKFRADVVIGTGSKSKSITLDRGTLTVRPLPPVKVKAKGDLKDLKSLWSKVPPVEFKGERKTKLPRRLNRAFIAAGDRVYAEGEDGLIAAIALPGGGGGGGGDESEDATIAWEGQVRGEVFSMIAGDDRLFVINREGWIFCFGGKPGDAALAKLPEASPAVSDDEDDPVLLLIKRGASWRHLSDGASPQDGWTALAFEDGDWKSDRVELDEDDDAPAKKDEDDDEKPRRATYYYRHVFNVADPARMEDVRLLMLADDKTQVYLNGKLLATLAEKAGTPDPKPPRDPRRNKRAAHEVAVASGLLAAGKNVLAVATPNQQLALDAEDLFNLELIAERREAPKVVKAEPAWATAAGRMLKLAGAQAGHGYAAVYGAGDGDLMEELARHTALHVIGIEPDESKVAAMRARFDKADLLGQRIVLHEGTPNDFALPPYLLSLAICEDVTAAGCTDQVTAIARVYAALRPYGGAAVIGIDESQRPIIETAVKEAKLHGADLTFTDGYAVLRRTGGPQGAGQWTHQNGDAGNTLVSSENAVKLPLGILWFGGPSSAKILPRHGHGPVPQVVDGRLIIEGPDILRAMDIYTGRLLWDRKLPAIGLYYNNTGHHPGAGAVGGYFVSLSDGIYVAYGRKALRLDPVTGATIAQFTLPDDGAERLKINGPIEVEKKDDKDEKDDRDEKDEDSTHLAPRDGGRLAERDGHSGGYADEPPYFGYINVHRDLLIVTSTPVPPLSTSRHKPDAKGLEARYGEGSRRLVVMDRHTGDVLWKRDAAFEFRHNTIVAGDFGGRSRIFAIDRLTDARIKLLKKRGVTLEGTPTLYALDAQTGQVLWENSEDMFGTWVGYSAKHDVLLQGGSKAKDRAGDEVDRGMIAYRGSTGEVLWQHEDKYYGPPLLHDRTIITQGEAYDLITGKQAQRSHPVTGSTIEWDWARNYGCNTAIGCQHLLTFRSAAAGFLDLTGDGGTGNLGGFRSSCTNNLIPAGGILSAPDYTRTCICSYQNQTSLALIHMPHVEVWTFNAIKWDGKPVKQLGINFGAPGDHRPASQSAGQSLGGATGEAAAGTTLWLDYPSTGGKSPDVPIKVTSADRKNPVGYYRHHTSHILARSADAAPLAFVAASGMRGDVDLEITLADRKSKGERPYTIRLIFCETERLEAGQRVFDVAINGEPALERFDIAAQGQGARRVVVKELTGIEVGEKLTVSLRSAAGSKPPVISGIEILAE